MSVEIRDGKKILVTPISTEDLKDIKTGDIVYVSGSLTTCRDSFYGSPGFFRVQKWEAVTMFQLPLIAN